MVTPDRLRWLLGDARPTWYIPDGIYTDELEFAAKQPHTKLTDLESVNVEGPGGLPEVRFRYVDEFQIEHSVSIAAAGLWAVARQVASASVWMRARADDWVRPLHLAEIVDTTTARVTRRSLAERLQHAGSWEGSVAELLGDAAGRVAGMAARRAAHRLEEMVDRGVITVDDHDAIDPRALIGALMHAPAHHVADLDLPSPASRLALHPSSTAVSWGAVGSGNGEVFSFVETGSIPRGKRAWFAKQVPKTKVTVNAGKVSVKGISGCRSLAKPRWCSGTPTKGLVEIYASQRSDVTVVAAS